MHVLHLTYQWPNIIYANSGIFINKTIEKLSENHIDAELSILSVNKAINKEYLKEKNFNLKNYFRFLLKKNYFTPCNNIGHRSMLYPPILGFSKATGYNANMAWGINKGKILRHVRKTNVKLVHAHFSNPDGYIAYKIKKKTGIPYIMHLHGADVQEFRKRTKREQDIIKLVYKNADLVICNSSKTQALLKEVVDKSIPSKIIAFGIDIPDTNQKRKEFNEPITILSVGNLVEIKGIQYALDALGDLKDTIDFNYHIIGSGPMLEKLKNKTAENKLESKVTFHGRKSHEYVMDQMQNADIFVLPSYNEAFGMVYLEALSAGCAVVGIQGQGCEDIHAKKDCIYMAKPKDKNSIADAINEICQNKKKREEYKSNGIEVAKKHFDWKAISKLYEITYKELIN